MWVERFFRWLDSRGQKSNFIYEWEEGQDLAISEFRSWSEYYPPSSYISAAFDWESSDDGFSYWEQTNSDWAQFYKNMTSYGEASIY